MPVKSSTLLTCFAICDKRQHLLHQQLGIQQWKLVVPPIPVHGTGSCLSDLDCLLHPSGSLISVSRWKLHTFLVYGVVLLCYTNEIAPLGYYDHVAKAAELKALYPHAFASICPVMCHHGQPK